MLFKRVIACVSNGDYYSVKRIITVRVGKNGKKAKRQIKGEY